MATGNDTIPTVRIADISFQPSGQSDNTLIIQLNSFQLSYAVYNSVNNTVMAYACHVLDGNESFSEALRILTTDEWTRVSYSKVKAVIEPLDFLLVPQALFDSNNISAYLNFHSLSKVNNIQLFDVIENVGLVGVYRVPSSLYEALNAQFAEIAILANPTPFVQLVSREYKSIKGDNLFVYLDHNRIHILALNQGKLLYYNSFEIATKEDVSYYALSVSEQLLFSPEKALVVVWGNGSNFEEQYNTLNYYFRNVQQGVRPLAMKFTDALNSLPVFAQYNLFAAAVCE